MHAAQITDFSQPPVWTSVPDIPIPESSPKNFLRIRIISSGVHSVVRSRASGKHYSSNATSLPLLPGVDGTGVISMGPDHPDNDKAVYFASFFAGGTFAEYITVPRRNVLFLPSGLDPTVAAAFTNPGLSSWLAIKERTKALPLNFTVVILGVTSASGSLAASLARKLGAGRVIGLARTPSAPSDLKLDEYISIASTSSSPSPAMFETLQNQPIDLILDYVSGPLTTALLTSLKSTTPTQYVHVGGLSGVMDFSLPSAVLRSKDLTIRGSGPGSFDLGKATREHLPGLLEALIESAKGSEMTIRKMSEIGEWWNRKEGVKGRLVFTN